MIANLSINTRMNRPETLLEDDTTLSQFSPDNSPTIKASFLPSEVLLFKGVPSDLREIEVMPLFEPYGLIKDILIAHHKRYLFIQFDTEVQATRCYQDYAKNVPQIRNHDLYVCYTGKSKISKPKALLNPTSRFLHIKFSPNYLDVNTNMVVQLLPSYSAYQRIWLHQNKNWEAYVEMDDVFKAIVAKEYIAQSQVYNNNPITVTYCSEREIPQRESTDLQKEEFKDNQIDDFALPPSMMETSAHEEVTNFSMTAFPCFSEQYIGGGSPMLSASPTYSHGARNIRSMSPVRHQSPILAKDRYSLIQPNTVYYDHGSPHLGSMSPPINGSMNGSPLIMPISMNQFSNINSYQTPMNNVLHVKDLPDNITPLMLFRLFGMYGNVLKVKILFNHPDKAFIEFQSPLQAELARRCLTNCPIMGNTLKVDFAKKGTVVDISLLKKEPDNKYLGDFSTSSEHRYKYVGSKNHANISPPSKVLHLSNMHPDKTEAFYKELFSNFGKIKRFFFMKNEEKMALVEMASVEDALNILMHFHNFDIDGKYLKVTFSKYKKVK